MAKQDYFYIKVRVSTNKELSKKQIEAVTQELDVTVKSGTGSVVVTEATIEETAQDYEMFKTV